MEIICLCVELFPELLAQQGAMLVVIILNKSEFLGLLGKAER